MTHEPVTGRTGRPGAPARQLYLHSAADGYRPCKTVAFLTAQGFSPLLLMRATRQAQRNGTTAASELIAHGLIGEEAYYRLLAAHAGLAFIAPADIAGTLSGEPESDKNIPACSAAWCRLRDGSIRAVAAPASDTLAHSTWLFEGPGRAKTHVALTAPSALRSGSIRRLRHRLGEEAAYRLANEMPRFSAKHGASAWHGFALAALAFTVGVGLFAAPTVTLYAVNLAVSLFFLASVALRLAAGLTYRGQKPAPFARVTNVQRPVYSVIVALYQEAPVVADLVTALKALNWPRSRLEIKLVCEEDDAETLDALARLPLDPRFEIVTVPRIGPRTKPKALNYALPFCTGSLITLYDAEDRPHPDQLEEAWRTFRRSSGRVAALQAPLVIANPRRNWITALFHIEYAAQFRGLLPFLAHHDLPVPLGGTSTHFRRAALEQCGDWDPHNVTEDADLGFRLWQTGYRVGTIRRPTLEDAPDRAAIWRRQRTRWIKGWLQTWLVNTRPGALRPRRNRWRGALVMHTLLAGTVVCSLFFPLTLLTIAAVAVWGLAAGEVPIAYDILAVINWANMLLAFGTHALLGLRATDPRLRLRALAALPAMPAYWLLGSHAGWRAVIQYFRKPFLWEKTPHAPHDPGGESHTL